MNIARKHIAFVLAASVLSFFSSGELRACFMRASQPVVVWLDHINVDIVDQVATKTYHCAFKNPNGGAIVGGTCYMELEPGAQVENMSVLVDGKELKAEILDVKTANRVFKDIVKNGGSPALLEYYGNKLIRTKIPKIAPGKTVMVKLTYTQVLKKKGDLIRLQMLNTNPKALMQPLKKASVTVNIKSTEAIKNIYSPTHKIDLVEKEDWDISVHWEKENYMPKHPFVLYYQTSRDSVGATIIAHRDKGSKEGHFMMMLSPTLSQGVGKITDDQILPKDVVFCVDTSGSMLKGEKMEQAKSALKYCLEQLRPGDRFNIVDFSTTAKNFKENLVELDDETREAALKYTNDLHARGGTAIEEALSNSLDQLVADKDDNRLKMIVFTTDGLPTIGERDTNELLESISKKNKQKVRIFVFGEGYGVNTKLLDFLAMDHHGEADYILPDEDITKKIGLFFDRVGSPVMTGMKLTIGSEKVKIKDQFPREIRDLYRGEQILIYGRYTGKGKATIHLSSQSEGSLKSMTFQVNFPKVSNDDRASFVPRIWAGQKIDYLLKQIRSVKKPDKEIIDEITVLAKQYGIVTPYTSYLMADDRVTTTDNFGTVQLRTRGLTPLSRKGGAILLKEQLQKKSSFESAPASRSYEIKQKNISDAKKDSYDRFSRQKSGNSTHFYYQAERELGEAGQKESALKRIRYIGNRTFYNSTGKEWQESLYNPDTKPDVETIVVGSDAYFELLDEDTRLAKYMALGDVTLQVNNRWYRIQNQVKKSEAVVE